MVKLDQFWGRLGRGRKEKVGVVPKGGDLGLLQLPLPDHP